MRWLAENIWLLRYAMPVLGLDLGRNVFIIRLTSGKLVIHSTARFSVEDIATIRQLGEPGWLVDVTMLIVVGHGKVIETNGRQIIRNALRTRGFDL